MNSFNSFKQNTSLYGISGRSILVFFIPEHISSIGNATTDKEFSITTQFKSSTS